MTKQTTLEIRNEVTGSVSTRILPLSMRLAKKAVRKALKRPLPNDDWMEKRMDQVSPDKIVVRFYRIDFLEANGGGAKTTTVEIHDDVRDYVTVLQLPEPLWLFAELLHRLCEVDPRENIDLTNGPVVGCGHIIGDKAVLRYHAGTPDDAIEWCMMLAEIPDEEEPDEGEDGDVEWWQR